MSDTPRRTLSAKHLRPVDYTRAPVRPGAPRQRAAGSPSGTASGTAPSSAPPASAPRKPRPAPTAAPKPPARGRPAAQQQRAEPATRTARPAKAAAPRKPAAPVKTAKPANTMDNPGSLRLSKRMSELGLCSRREADEWIVNGWVRVDGIVVDELGSKVLPSQTVTVDRAAKAQQAQRVTILLHKPVGYVSGQPEDNYPPAVTLVTLANRWADDDKTVRFLPQHLRGLAPAGRLDIDSTGLLVFTQDGRIARQLIGAESEIEKEYLVRVTYESHHENVQPHFPTTLLDKLRHGLSLDGVPLKPAKVSWQNPEQLRFVLREGKKRQIRRMCELVGLRVTSLKRVRMGQITLGALPPGQWRYLRSGERF